MGSGQDRLEKFQALDGQFVAHSQKFQDGAEAKDFYKAKKALSDMVSFHNEMVKIRDRFDRKKARDIVEAMEERLETTRGHPQQGAAPDLRPGAQDRQLDGAPKSTLARWILLVLN